MANNLYVTRSFSGNYPLMLSRQIMFQQQKTMYWGKWAKFNTDGMQPIQKNKEPKTVNSPVIFHYELGKEPGDWLKVPILRN